jgi:tripeptidyl-peptidase-1
LYSIKYKPIATHKNTFGIVEFTPQSFLTGDLDLFFGNFSPSQVGVRPIPVLIDGAVVQTTNQSFDFNGESDLDLEYAMSLTNPQPITLLQTGDLVEGAGFDNWLDAVDGSFCTFEGGDDPTQDGIYPDTLPGGFDGPESCGIVAPPHTVSVSYLQDESTVTAAFANRQCSEYAKLGMMGTTVFHSSGDNGVAGNGGVCLNSTLQPVEDGTVFNPGFPASCPFVTAVGATQVNPGSTVNDPEGACEQVIFSGGGFSNIFPLPSFQAEDVKSFLKNHPPPFTNGEFNDNGNARGFPDLSANGANYVIGIDGEFELVFGTSASSPVTGSIFTLVNDARLAIGKRPVGFLNPLIYSPIFRSAFNDITSGGNQGCGTPGFTATTGWDPVTGVGTPNLSKLLILSLLLP